MDELAESIQFLRWLAAGHFTLLGMRIYDFLRDGEERRLQPRPGSSLGLLRDPEISVLRRTGSGREMSRELVEVSKVARRVVETAVEAQEAHLAEMARARAVAARGYTDEDLSKAQALLNLAWFQEPAGDRKADVAATVQDFVAFDGPAFLEVIIDPEAGVYPMVGPGMAYTEMITGDFIPSREPAPVKDVDKSEMF